VQGCDAAVEIGWQSCFGRCTQGPNVLIREVLAEEPSRPRSLAAPRAGAGRNTALYNRITVARVGEMVRGHIAEGRVQRQLIERPRIIDSTPATKPGTEGDS
jgi:(2Fe-2S) ferredoxin